MSSQSHFTSFAVAGGLTNQGPISASLGGFVTRALLAEGAKVRILGRASAIGSPAAVELASAGATITEVDYGSPASLAKALEGVDVVISTLAGPGFAAQTPLAEAAKSAGVQLFVPSEFGNVTAGLPSDSALYGKTALQAKLKEIDLPSLLVFSGVFADWIQAYLPVVNNEIIIVGQGDAPIAFTSREDVSRFLAHILVQFPTSKLLTIGSLPLYASLVSFNSLAAKYPGKTVKHESHEVALQRFKEKGDFLSWLKVEWDSGRGGSDGAGNKLWPEWNPKGVETFL